MTGTRQDNRLRSIAVEALRPQKFPPRRDVELAADCRSDSEHVAFSDHFWLSDAMLAVVAVRLAGAEAQTALKAAALRHLIRATLTEFHEAQAALAATRGYLVPLQIEAVDIAVLVVDARSGSWQAASLGHGFAGEAKPRTSDRAWAAASLPVRHFWVMAGGVAVPDAGPSSGEAPSALVAAVLGAAGGAAAVIAMELKPKARSNDAASLFLANDLAEIPRVLSEIEGFCSARALPEAITLGLDVALDEVLSNIILYGYRDGGEHQISIEMHLLNDSLVLEVRDDGVAFDPLQAAEPDLSLDLEHRPIGGLGLHFIKTVLDAVTYQRIDGWNVLTLKKHRESADADAAAGLVGSAQA